MWILCFQLVQILPRTHATTFNKAFSYSHTACIPYLNHNVTEWNYERGWQLSWFSFIWWYVDWRRLRAGVEQSSDTSHPTSHTPSGGPFPLNLTFDWCQQTTIFNLTFFVRETLFLVYFRMPYNKDHMLLYCTIPKNLFSPVVCPIFDISSSNIWFFFSFK